TFIRGYVGLTVQEQVTGSIIQAHNWYGKYRVNVIKNEIIAVDFKGRGPNYASVIAPYYLQQRIVNADGKILYTHPKIAITTAGVSKGQLFPEASFGTFD